MVTSSPETRALNGAKMQEFLHDDTVNAAFSRLERRYYEAFKSADSSDKRVTAWAKANALADLQQELLSVVADGEDAVAELNLLAQRLEARRTGRPLPHE